MAVKLDVGKLVHLIQKAPSQADRIVAQSAHMIEAGAKVAAPVDTGALRASITAQKAGDAHYRIGPSVEYGRYVELGTRHAPAHPFLMPAFRAELPHLKRNLKGVAE